MGFNKRSVTRLICVMVALAVAQFAFAAGSEEMSDSGGAVPGEVTVIVPYSAGGGTDRSARTVAKYLEDTLGATIVVVNRPGAGGAFGMEEIIEAEPDGATIGLVPFPALVTTLKNTDYSPEDFDFLASFTQTPPALILAPDSQFGSLDELVAFASENPGRVVAAESGDTLLLSAILFQDEANIDITTVNYDGAGESLSALLGGHVDAAFISAQFIETARAEGAVPVAVANDERLEALPEVPTYSENGYEVVTPISRIMAAPQGIPDSTRQELVRALTEVGESEDFRQDMIDGGEIPRLRTDEDATEYVLSGARRINELYEKYEDKFARE